MAKIDKTVILLKDIYSRAAQGQRDHLVSALNVMFINLMNATDPSAVRRSSYLTFKTTFEECGYKGPDAYEPALNVVKELVEFLTENDPKPGRENSDDLERVSLETFRVKRRERISILKQKLGFVK
tara:strand:+ start:1463 stop:1840 length:378 start_codon:yes stop_codon:yes gene_type:complete